MNRTMLKQDPIGTESYSIGALMAQAQDYIGIKPYCHRIVLEQCPNGSGLYWNSALMIQDPIEMGSYWFRIILY